MIGEPNVYEGLLRKYKISKITGIKLSEKEYVICKNLDNTLKDLVTFNNDTYQAVNAKFVNCSGDNILTYLNVNDINFLYVDPLCYCCLYLYLDDYDKKVVIKSWVEDLYDLKIDIENIFLMKL